MLSMINVFCSLAFIFSTFGAEMDMSTCGTTKGCLFAPPECKPSADCGIVFTYKVDGKYLNIELSGKAPSPNGFVAVGFSKDDKMGDDMVVFCADMAGQITGGLAWNSKEKTNTITSNDGVQNVLEASNTGEKLYCAINQQIDSNQSNTYNLNNPYHILLAAGPTKDNGLRYHQTDRYVLPKVSLSDYAKGTGMPPKSPQAPNAPKEAKELIDGGKDTSHSELMNAAHGFPMILPWSILLGTAML